VAILGVGVVLLFVFVSVGDAIDKKRAGARAGADHTVAANGSAPQAQPAAANGSAPQAQPAAANGSAPQAQPVAANGSAPQAQPVAANGVPANGAMVRPPELHLWTPIVAPPMSVRGEPRPIGL